MKVAIVSITRAHLLNLAIALEKKDDIEVVFYTLSPKNRLRRFGYQGKIVSCFFPLGICCYATRFCAKKFPFKYRQLINHKFRKWFDQWISLYVKPCDILIGNNGDAYFTSLKAKKQFNPLIICDQGSSHIIAQDAVNKELEVFLNPWNTRNLISHYSISDYLMVPSEYVKTTDIENSIPESKILYNPFGVDCRKFLVTKKPKKDSFDILMVGRWSKAKGCDLLLNAVLQLNNITLLHVGHILDLPFPNNKRFFHVDTVPEHELTKYYAKAKIFVLPSRTEGMALVTLQACSSGLPIVSSKNAGGVDVRNITGASDSFFIVEEPLSVESLKDSLLKALEYADSLPEGPRIQYGDVKNKISWEAYGERYYDILKTLNHE